ncbi:hypothetical protein CR513_02709, partial [Mucuna pruriens]
MLFLQEFDIEMRDKKGAENLLENFKPWFVDTCNFLAALMLPHEASRSYKEKIKSDAKCYFCHSVSGGDHYESHRTAQKVLNCGFYWPTIFWDADHYVFTREQCQRIKMASTKGMRCPDSRFFFVKFLMYGVSTSWAHSLSPTIMFQDGWRLKPPK